jgi:hypothetical protein
MEFPRFEFACGGYSTGGLRPPLLVLLQRPFAGKNGDFCGAQTHKRRASARVGVIIVLATGNASSAGTVMPAARRFVSAVVEPFGQRQASRRLFGRIAASPLGQRNENTPNAD